MSKKIYFSKLLKTTPKYQQATERLVNNLFNWDISCVFVENTNDIWMRDFMPVKTKSGAFVSF